MLMYSQQNACFKHSNFFTVNDGYPLPDNLMPNRISPRMARDSASSHTECVTGRSCQKSNYELFNCNNFNIRYWSWNYRGCWHQTCPPIDTR